MMATVEWVVSVLATFVIAPLGSFCLMARWLNPTPERLSLLFFSSVGLGPMAIAFAIWLGYLLVPGMAHGVYFWGVLVATSGLAGFALSRWRLWIDALIEQWRSRPSSDESEPGLLLLNTALVLLGISVAVLIFSVPLFNNDPMEYQLISRELFQARDMGIYPLNTATDVGLYANVSHPPGFNMQLVWSYYIGGSFSTVPSRFLTAFFFFALLACIWNLTRPFGRVCAAYAVLALLGARYLDQLAISVHTDPQRLYFFVAAVTVAGFAIRSGRLSAVLATGFVGGVAAFSHSIGLLAAPFALSAYFLLGPSKTSKRFVQCLLGGAVAFAVGGGQYMVNTINMGVPLADYEPVLEMPSVDYAFSVLAERDLIGLWERLLNGAFQGFTRVNLFGAVHWLGLAGLMFVFVFRKLPQLNLSDAWLKCCAAVIVFFYSMLLVGALANVTLVIKNARYIMTATPLFAVFAGIVCGWVHCRLWPMRNELELRKWFWSTICALVMPVGVYAFTLNIWVALVAGVLAVYVFWRVVSNASVESVGIGTLLGVIWWFASASLAQALVVYIFADWAHRLWYRKPKPPSKVALPLGGLSVLILLGLALSPVGLQNLYWAYKYAQPSVVWNDTEGEAVLYDQDYPGADMLASLQKRTEPDARYLSYRQSDFGFYANKRWIRHIDPRLAAVYESDNVEDTYRGLKALGVTHAAVPNYLTATYFNTHVREVFADPTLSEIEVFRQSGYRTVTLRPQKLDIKARCLPLGDAFVEVGGILTLPDLKLSQLVSNRVDIASMLDEQLALRVFIPDDASGTTMRLQGRLRGAYRISISAQEMSDVGKPLAQWSQSIWNSTSRSGEHVIDAQFPVLDGTRTLRILMRSTGQFNPSDLDSLNLCSYVGPDQDRRVNTTTVATPVVRHDCDPLEFERSVGGRLYALRCASAFSLDRNDSVSSTLSSDVNDGAIYGTSSFGQLAQITNDIQKFAIDIGEARGPIGTARRVLRDAVESFIGKQVKMRLVVDTQGEGRLQPIIHWRSARDGGWQVSRLDSRPVSRHSSFEAWSVIIPEETRHVVVQVFQIGPSELSETSRTGLEFLNGVRDTIWTDTETQDVDVSGLSLAWDELRR